MAKYRCKPVEVDAIRFREAKQRVFDGGAPEWVRKAVDGHVVEFFQHSATVRTLEGLVTSPLDSWLVCGALGEMWPVQDAQFEHKYEPVEEDAS